jgi:hypothetical protein
VFPEWQEVEVERRIEIQGRVLMKMIIPNQDKVKRLLLLQLDAHIPEEEQKWIQATLSKKEESGIWNNIYYTASAVSPNANHQVQRVPLFTDDHTVKPVPNAAQTLEDQPFEDPESGEQFLQCLTPIWHKDFCWTIGRV